MIIGPSFARMIKLVKRRYLTIGEIGRREKTQILGSANGTPIWGGYNDKTEELDDDWYANGDPEGLRSGNPLDTIPSGTPPPPPPPAYHL